MMKWIIHISFLFSVHCSYSQWEHLTSFNSGSDTLNIKDFHFFNVDEGILFCSKSTENPNHLWGYILKTIDGGASWDTLRIMKDTVPISVQFTSEVVGHLLCKIPQHTEIRTLSTSDAGINWTAKSLILNANPPYQDINFYNDTIGIYSTSGFSAITHDGGDSWELLNNVGGGLLNIADGFVLLGSGSGFIYSYDTLHNYSSNSIISSASMNGQDLSITSSDTTLFFSANGNNGFSLDYPHFNYGILVNYNKNSEDITVVHFPEKYTRQIYSNGDYLLAGCMDLTGQGEQILKSIDNGQTWYTQEIIESNLIYSLGIQIIQCINDTTCFATDRDRIYKTTNGGGPLLEQVGHQVYLGTDENVKEQHGLTIYPNPATDHLNIRASQPIQEITIVDLNGRLVYSEKTSDLNTTIQVGMLSTGVYMVHVQTEQDTFRRKIVKQ
jgi:hypothetical protein